MCVYKYSSTACSQHPKQLTLHKLHTDSSANCYKWRKTSQLRGKKRLSTQTYIWMKRIHIRTCSYCYNACCCSNANMLMEWNNTDFQRQNMQRKKPWEGGIDWVSMKTVLLLTFSSSSYSETLRSSALFSCGKKWHPWATTTYVLGKSHQLYCQHIQIQTCHLFYQGITWN